MAECLPRNVWLGFCRPTTWPLRRALGPGNRTSSKNNMSQRRREEERKRGRRRKPQDVSINQKAKASSTKNSSKEEPSGEREHKKSFLIPKVSSVSASSMVAISRRCLLVTKSKREPGQYHWQGTRGYSFWFVSSLSGLYPGVRINWTTNLRPKNHFCVYIHALNFLPGHRPM